MSYFVVTIKCRVGEQFKWIPATVDSCEETEAFGRAVRATSSYEPVKLEDGSYQDGVFNYECIFVEEVSYEEYRLISKYC